MPIHDWTRVTAGTFHDTHVVWLGNIRTALNGGILYSLPNALQSRRRRPSHKSCFGTAVAFTTNHPCEKRYISFL